MSRQKPAINPAFAIVIIASVLLIVSLIKNAVGLYQSRSRLESVKLSVSELEAAKQALEKDILLQNDPVSTDQIIRNKLNLSLPGETLVVITGTASATPTPQATLNQKNDQQPPYLQWWHLFANK
jgi:hypothetical protein